MKENIDKIIKKSLEGFETPYDPKAWESMHKALDKKMPTNGGSNWKWYFGGAAVIGIVVGSALLINNHSTQDTAEKLLTQTEANSEDQPATKPTLPETQSNSNSASPLSSDAEKMITNNGSSISESNGTEHTNDLSQQTINNQATDNTASYQQSNPYKVPNNNQLIEKESEVILPEINSVCKGETIKIDNRGNSVAIYVIDPSGNKTAIKAATKGSFNATEDGTHFIAQMRDGRIVKKESFQVLSLPAVDMSFDNENKYDRGVPSTTMTSGSNGSTFEWNLGDDQGVVYGKTIEAHYFKDDNYTVSLTLTGSNGCKATESMKVSIDNDYKLMAVDAFNPNSAIDVNRTFMPYALKERNTAFTLLIIDPSTGSIIYETSDVAQPWTGVDRRNGQMVEFNKSFVWKVVLKTPMKGERSDYAGSVVLTSFR